MFSVFTFTNHYYVFSLFHSSLVTRAAAVAMEIIFKYMRELKEKAAHNKVAGVS